MESRQQSENKSTSCPWGRLTVAFVLGMVLVLGLHTGGPLVRWPLLLPAVWLLPACLAVVGFIRYRREPLDASLLRELSPAIVLMATLVLYLVSSAALGRDFFFMRWLPDPGWRGMLLNSWAAKFFLMTACLTPLFFLRLGRRFWVVMFVVLVVGQYRCISEFVRNTNGSMLYGFDHPSFMFRLWAFARSFPHVIYYNPFWNAGRAVSYVIASGVSSIGTLLWPLWRFAPVHAVYTPTLGFMFIVAFPLINAASVRLLRGSWTAAFVTAALSLGVNRQYFVWLLHFGTLGACFAMSFMPLVSAALCRALWEERRTVWLGVLIVVSSILCVSWPPMAALATPLVLSVLFSAKQWTLKKIGFLAACAACIVVGCLPLLGGLLMRMDVAYFVQSTDDKIVLHDFLMKGWSRLADNLREGSPLLVFLGMLGALVIPRKDIRWFFGPLVVGLLLVSGWGKEIKPELELARAILPLCLVATIPAGLWIGDLLERRSAHIAPMQAAVLALIGMSILNASKFYENRSTAPYRLMSSEITGLVEFLKENTPEDGRIMFAGPAAHAFDGGTVAYLPVMCDREMMAVDYYQFSPKRVVYQYPPVPYRRKIETTLEFCETYNVTHIITFNKRWLKRLRKHPESFEQVYDFPGERRDKAVFRIIGRQSSMFLEGSGTVDAGMNYIRVHVDDPDGPAVIKYNWIDRIRAPEGVTIEPYVVDENISLIRILPNGHDDVLLTYKVWR